LCQIKYTGNISFWYSNGQIEYDIHVKNGKIYKLVRWYVGGDKHTEYEFKDGYCHGKRTINECDEFYDNGKKVGTHTKWFDNGKLASKCDYDDGKLNGKVTKWYENGDIHWEEYYVAGLPVGEHTEWHNNGTKTRYKYVNNILTTIQVDQVRK
jgi:antitoxin component YwqK of YwqJK toxin-antitoxin module